jgi:hypothetical protein
LKDKDRYKEFLDYCGDRPRVYRNIVIFLCPIESERINFERTLKRKLAWEEIEKDKKLHLTDEQRKRVKEELKKLDVKEAIRNLYRIILIPSKGDIKEFDLGISTYGVDINIGKEVYDRLKSEGEILEKLSYIALKDKYLKNNDYVQTKNILDAFYKTPGEVRIINENVVKEAIKEGVRQGEFGVGVLKNGKPRCKYFKEESSPELIENEVIIKPELCKISEYEIDTISDREVENIIEEIKKCDNVGNLIEIRKKIYKYKLTPEQQNKIEKEIIKKENELKSKLSEYYSINLVLNIPKGKFSNVKRVIDFIQTKFKNVIVKVEIKAEEGSISKSEYEDKIREALNQAEISIEDEKFK